MDQEDFPEDEMTGSDNRWPVEYRQCESITLEGTRCRRTHGSFATVTRLGGRWFCAPHLDDVVDGLVEALDKVPPLDSWERRHGRDHSMVKIVEAVERLLARDGAEAFEAKIQGELDERVRREEATVVYYVERDGYIKIGKTLDLAGRLKALARGGTKCPPGMTIGPVTLLATHKGGGAAEKAMHRKFAMHRVVGEWFDPAPELMEHIEHVALGKHWGRRITDGASGSDDAEVAPSF